MFSQKYREATTCLGSRQDQPSKIGEESDAHSYDLIVVMANLAVNYFTSFFYFANGVHSSDLIDIISSLVIDPMNTILSSIPSSYETKAVVFGLKKESASDPNGFGGIFFQTY